MAPIGPDATPSSAIGLSSEAKQPWYSGVASTTPVADWTSLRSFLVILSGAHLWASESQKRDGLVTGPEGLERFIPRPQAKDEKSNLLHGPTTIP